MLIKKSTSSRIMLENHMTIMSERAIYRDTKWYDNQSKMDYYQCAFQKYFTVPNFDTQC